MSQNGKSDGSRDQRRRITQAEYARRHRAVDFSVMGEWVCSCIKHPTPRISIISKDESCPEHGDG